MAEKSKAQLRSEAEVARIMKERGISTSKPKHPTSFKVRPSIIIVFILCIIGVAAYLTNGFGLLKKDLKDRNSYKEESAEMAAYKAEISALRSCLSDINNDDIPLGDAEFWNKYIARYEAILNCYDSHPDPVNAQDRSNIEANLAKAKENSATAEANELSYRQQMADLNEEYNAYRAKYDAEIAELDRQSAENNAKTEEWLANYDKQRAELDAKYAAEAAQRAAQEEARKRAEEIAAAEKEAKCNEYKALYGDKTADELAKTDSEVNGAKYRCDSAKVRSCTGSRTQSQRELCESYRSQELETKNSYCASYNLLLSQKQTYYTSLRISSCGY